MKTFSRLQPRTRRSRQPDLEHEEHTEDRRRHYRQLHRSGERAVRDLPRYDRSGLADVSSAEAVDVMVNTTLNTFGGLNVMLNNAGIVREAARHVLEADEDWWDLIVDTNLKGHFLCSLTAAKHMASHGGGTIITMSSGGAARAHRGMVAYDAVEGWHRGDDPSTCARSCAVQHTCRRPGPWPHRAIARRDRPDRARRVPTRRCRSVGPAFPTTSPGRQSFSRPTTRHT